MHIGPALAIARTEAGMSVEDVSERTRIRRTIINDIERDDYSTCGGDFYARGHIRAIAKAVGTDPAPLIEEYDGSVVSESEAPLTGPDPATGLTAAAEANRHHALGSEPAPQPEMTPGMRGGVSMGTGAGAAFSGAGSAAWQAGSDVLQRVSRLRIAQQRPSRMIGGLAIVLAVLILVLYAALG